jgi:hypothetical protein
MPVTHAFVSAKSDGGDATLVRASNWNAEHVAPPWIVTLSGGATVTPPAGVTEIDGTRTVIDFTNLAEIHLVTYVTNAAATGTLLVFQTSPDQSAWTTRCDVAVDATGLAVGYLGAVSLGEVYCRLATIDGDNSNNLIVGPVTLREGGEAEPAAGPFASDTFTDTATTSLASHTPTSGGSWTKHANSTAGNAVISNANRVRNPTAGGQWNIYYHSATPAAADYDVSATVVMKSDNNVSAAGPMGRIDTSETRGYLFVYNTSANGWRLFKVVSGTFTQLGSTYSQTLTVDVEYVAKLEMVGTAIKGYVDGVQRISVTDSSVTATGKAGLWLEDTASDSVGLSLDTWEAEDA